VKTFPIFIESIKPQKHRGRLSVQFHALDGSL